MTDIAGVAKVFETYSKYGWILRRILVAKDSSPPTVESDVTVTDGPVDAAWFSRPPGEGPIAWEIRFLGELPFALLESLDESDPEFESQLRAIEDRLASAVLAKLDKTPT